MKKWKLLDDKGRLIAKEALIKGSPDKKTGFVPVYYVGIYFEGYYEALVGRPRGSGCTAHCYCKQWQYRKHQGYCKHLQALDKASEQTMKTMVLRACNSCKLKTQHSLLGECSICKGEER